MRNKILIAATILVLFVAGAVLAGHPVKPCGIVTSPVQFTMTDKLLVATGTFKNDSRNDYRQVLITVQFLDAKGNRVDGVSKHYYNVKAGGTYDFKVASGIRNDLARTAVSAKVVRVDAYIDN